MPERPTEEGVGEQVKTIEYRFYEAINENKERDEPSVSEASRRRQATIYSEGQEIPPPQPTMRTELDIGARNPVTTTVTGFLYPIFQVKLGRYPKPKTAFEEDLN